MGQGPLRRFTDDIFAPSDADKSERVEIDPLDDLPLVEQILAMDFALADITVDN